MRAAPRPASERPSQQARRNDTRDERGETSPAGVPPASGPGLAASSHGPLRGAPPRPDAAPWSVAAGEPQAPLAESRKRSRRQDDGTAAATAAAPSVHAADLELAAYLLARDITGRPVSAASKDLLQRANESKKEVLGMMAFGRANVLSDLDATGNHGFYRLRAQRHIIGSTSSVGEPPSLSFARDAGISAYAGSGNCGEFANVAAHVHASRLRDGERLTIQAASDADHSWVTIQGRQSPGGTVPGAVLDVWADGPVIEPVDGRFFSDPSRSPIIVHGMDHREASVASSRFEAVRQDPGARNARQLGLLIDAHTRDEIQPTGTLYLSTPVLSDAFCGAARVALEHLRHHPALPQAAVSVARELAVPPDAEWPAAERIVGIAAALDVPQARSLIAPRAKRARRGSDSG